MSREGLYTQSGVLNTPGGSLYHKVKLRIMRSRGVGQRKRYRRQREQREKRVRNVLLVPIILYTSSGSGAQVAHLAACAVRYHNEVQEAVVRCMDSLVLYDECLMVIRGDTVDIDGERDV